MLTQKKGGGGPNKEVKEFIGSNYQVFGNTLVRTGLQLRVQVEIHIRGLSVWSMSQGITTTGEVSWQTGPSHWMVLKTSLHSYINRIKTPNGGLLVSFEHSGGEERTSVSSKCSQERGRPQIMGFEKGFRQLWSWIWIFKSISQHKK